jgi:hypothetical protein
MRLLPLLLLTACAVPTPDYGVPSDPKAELKPQLPFTVDGVQYQGAATVPRQTLSLIGVQLPAKTVLIIVSTCARQDEYWQPDNSKKFEYKYSPAMWVENVGACPMSIIAVTGAGEWHRAIIDYANTPKDPLITELACNGRWQTVTGGAQICSVKEGKPVVLKAVGEAVISKDPNSECPTPKSIGRYEWEIPAKKGFCVYVVLNDKQEFRLTVHGYSSFLKVFPPKE